MFSLVVFSIGVAMHLIIMSRAIDQRNWSRAATSALLALFFTAFAAAQWVVLG